MLLKLPGHALDSIAQFSSFGDTSRYSLFVFTWRMQLSFVCRAWRAQFEDEFSVERVAIHLNAISVGGMACWQSPHLGALGETLRQYRAVCRARAVFYTPHRGVQARGRRRQHMGLATPLRLWWW